MYMNTYKKNTVQIEHHGRKIFGVSYMPEGDKNIPIVIFCHGFNGINTDFSVNSEYLASKGIASFCFDFCGGSINSKSDLRTSEMTIFTEKEDLIAVIDYIKHIDLINKNNIFLFGASQGGLVSSLAADEYTEDIKGLLMLFPAFCIPDNWNDRFPTIDSIPDTVELWGVTLGRVFFEAIHGYDVFSQIGKYNKKVIIFHGDKDEVVPQEYVEKAASFYQEVEIEIFPGEGHGFSEQGNRKVNEMTYEFIKANSKA